MSSPAEVHAAGLVIKDLPLRVSNFRATMTLADYLQREGTVAIADIDTRRLTRRAAQQRRAERLHRQLPGRHGGDRRPTSPRPWRGARRRRRWPAWTWRAWCRRREPYEWTETEWQLGRGYGRLADAAAPRRGLRLRRQAQHPAHAGQPRLPRHRGAGADAGGRGAGAEARRRLPQQRPGRPRALRLRDRGHARADRHRHAHLRHLPGPPDHGAGLGRARPSR